MLTALLLAALPILLEKLFDAWIGDPIRQEEKRRQAEERRVEKKEKENEKQVQKFDEALVDNDLGALERRLHELRSQ